MKWHVLIATLKVRVTFFAVQGSITDIARRRITEKRCTFTATAGKMRLAPYLKVLKLTISAGIGRAATSIIYELSRIRLIARKTSKEQSGRKVAHKPTASVATHLMKRTHESIPLVAACAGRASTKEMSLDFTEISPQYPLSPKPATMPLIDSPGFRPFLKGVSDAFQDLSARPVCR